MTVDHSTARTSAVSRRFAPFFLLFAPVALALTGCGAESEEVGAHGAAAPAMQVATEAAEGENIELTASLQGRTRPFAVSEVRPQVTGLIQKRLFEEGEAVEEGTPLYQIEDSEYRAAVESASASLARARANANVAGDNAERLKGLVAIKAVSDQQYDEAEAAAAQARADVAMAKAALTQAKINLDRTTIRAPISGKIGRSSVTPGALVTQNQASTLATIRQLDPLYVDLTAAATDVLRWKRAMASDLTSAETKVPVTVTLEDGSTYEHQGQLAFSEVSVDETSGTVVLRAIVPNPDGYLLPGMFVRASLPVGQLEGAILVSQAAVMRTPTAEPYVLVVGENGTAEQRMLTIAQAQAGDWVVTGGLPEGSQVITSGLQMLRPGAPVAAIEKTQDNSSSNVANAAGNAAL
ncbi:efflux RND transporter periplasmic adaptor subunit [Parvularcula marina]|uniref:efflux RND transporter periplasmic adaptor subunit n=1 Tax=Parvularcula marina TaxID=2292771 RepID=UPI0035129CBE